MKKINNKAGITLFMLLVTIVIVVILVSISMMGAKNAVDNTVVTTFGNELKQIEDAVDTYYVSNGELPSKNNIAAVNQDTLLSRVDAKKQDTFKMELRSNGDYQEDGAKGEFYELDLTKLAVNNSSRGYGDKGDKKDQYMIAFPSMNIYYVKGVNAKNTTFYSLAAIVENTNIKIENKSDTSTVKLTSLRGVTVIKNNSQWMRSMGVTLMSNLLRDETLHLYVAGANVEKQFIETNIDPTILSFNTIGEASSKLIGGLSMEEQTAFENASAKYLEIIKKKNGVEVGKERIDLSNYDNDAPYLKSTNLKNYNDMNVLSCVVSDENPGIASGVKEVRYAYITKYASNGTETTIADGVTYGEEYMKTKAKKAEVSQGGIVDIKLPKDIKKIKIAVIDHAGNIQISEIDAIDSMFVSYRLNRAIESSIFLDLYITSAKGVSSIQTYVSEEGANYSNAKTIPLNTAAQSSTALVEYNNIANIDHVFVKVVVTDNNPTIADRKTESKIIEINNGVLEEQTWITDGCVLRLDAKNNVGENNYSDKAKIWKDLSIAGHNSKLNCFEDTATSGWTKEALKLDGVNDFVDTGIDTVSTCNPLGNFTLSVMVDFNTITATGYDEGGSNGDTGALIGGVNWSGAGIIWKTEKGDASKAKCFGYIRHSHRNYDSVQSSNTSEVMLTTADKKVQLVQVYNKTEGYMALYCNGTLVSKAEVLTQGYDLTESGFASTIGNIRINYVGIYGGNYRATNTNINVYTASIYNRALTEQEVKQNYAYDRANYPK